MRKGKKTFIANIEWWEAMADHPAKVRHEVLEAIFIYAATGEVPKLGRMAASIFPFIKREMDFNDSKWEGVSLKRAKAASMRWNKGKDGGSTGGGDANASFASVCTSDNDCDYDHDHDNDHDNDDDDDGGNGTDSGNWGSVALPACDGALAGQVRANGGDDGTHDRLSQEIDEMSRSQTWLYNVQRTLGRTMAELLAMLPAFETDCRANGYTGHRDRQDAMSHFCNWVRKKDEQLNKNQNEKATTTHRGRNNPYGIVDAGRAQRDAAVNDFIAQAVAKSDGRA